MGRLKLQTGNFTLVDDDVEQELSFLEVWHNTKNGYAYVKTLLGNRVSVHRFVMRPPKGILVDHINGDKLDNRRINLRLCSRAQNSANRPKRRQAGLTSPFKGVQKNTGCETYTARCGNVYLGSFPSQEEAAHAYDEAARKRFGEFALLNFPKD